MPHQCTNCDRSFADGSKEMLGGCPDCGGNKFQFLPPGATGPPDGTATASPDGSTTAAAAQGAADPAGDIIEAPEEPPERPRAELEDRAQASARSDVVTPDELPPVAAGEESAAPSEPDPEPDRPDLTQLRRELDEQFESIKILQPGEYELNLMELYDRQEYIIALEEDGRYVIDVPDTWQDAA